MDPTENVPSPHEQLRYTEVSLFSMDNGLGRCHQQSHNTCSRVLLQSTGTTSLWNRADSHPLAQSWASNSLHMHVEMSLVPLGARSKTTLSSALPTVPTPALSEVLPTWLEALSISWLRYRNTHLLWEALLFPFSPNCSFQFLTHCSYKSCTKFSSLTTGVCVTKLLVLQS